MGEGKDAAAHVEHAARPQARHQVGEAEEEQQPARMPRDDHGRKAEDQRAWACSQSGLYIWEDGEE